MAIRGRLKWFLVMLWNYGVLIAITSGLRFISGMDFDYRRYAIMTPIVVCFLAFSTFVKPEHIDKVFPKDSRIALLLILTLRFSPIMLRRMTNIKHAQQMRGARFDGTSQISNFVCLMVPTMVMSLAWATRLADSLQTRGEK